MIIADQPLGDERRLERAINFNRDGPANLDSALNILDRNHCAMGSNAGARWHRRRKPHAIESIIERSNEIAVDPDGLPYEMADEGKSQEAVRYSRAEYALGLRALHIDVNPLAILDRLGESADSRLLHDKPVADADFLPHKAAELLNPGDYS